jgi:hypothetical protein
MANNFEYLEERDGVTVEDIDRRGGEVKGFYLCLSVRWLPFIYVSQLNG